MSLRIVSVLVAVVALGLSCLSISAEPSRPDMNPDIENVPAGKFFSVIQFEGIKDGIVTRGLLIYGPIPGDEDDCLRFTQAKTASFGRLGFQVAGKCVEDRKQKEEKPEELRVNNYAQK